ncbi:MAG TPA: SAM-dependent methyltransferase, partial [Acidimicrobiales bacterium]|nr:SAM-dependent methyltransferase [Acidimicrobiales bacterium]
DLGGQPFRVVVADLSFISLRLVAARLVGSTARGGDLVLLVKPQFEAGRQEASRGKGVIRDPQLWREAVEGAIAAMEAAGATMMGIMVSPLRGADGNVEFLAHLGAGGGPGLPSLAITADLEAALARAGSDRGN